MTWQFSADPHRQALYEQSLPVRQYLEADRAVDGEGAFVMLADKRRLCGNPHPTKFPWLFWEEMETYYTG